jgi:hypothetical protein
MSLKKLQRVVLLSLFGDKFKRIRILATKTVGSGGRAALTDYRKYLSRKAISIEEIVYPREV